MLDKKTKKKIKDFVISLKLYFLSFFNSNLGFYFKVAGTSKNSDAYEAISSIIKRKKIKNILEIGIGGHANDYEGGLSILALKQFFPNSKIIGVDIAEKKFLDSKRIKTIKLDQSNSEELKEMAKLYGKFDLIIDDGSHFCDHQRKTFLTLFEYLNDDGFYIIEDINNSYKVAGGGSPELDYEKNNVTFFKDLIHVVNSNFLHKEIQKKYNEFVNIDKFLFFPGIIILQKKIKKTEPKTKEYLHLTLDEFNKYWTEKKNMNISKSKSGILYKEKKF
tara:strand:- start:59804 stop:60631 length:828 start_codon:yes stop_codon:yes gene_type:complete